MPREVTYLLVGAVYHPLKANSSNLTDYLITTCSHPNAGILLLSDFNQLPESRLKSYPLQQVVITTTRGKSILDKIFTSVSTWYQTPITLPAVTRSDHATIQFQPVEDPPCPTKSVKVTYRRLNSYNRRAFLFNHLRNWSHLY